MQDVFAGPGGGDSTCRQWVRYSTPEDGGAEVRRLSAYRRSHRQRSTGTHNKNAVTLPGAREASSSAERDSLMRLSIAEMGAGEGLFVVFEQPYRSSEKEGLSAEDTCSVSTSSS